MILIIENEINDTNDVDVYVEFVYICNNITSVENEKSLREKFRNLKLTHFFCGFGGHHMWVHQKSFEDIRIIFVPFERHLVTF